MDALLRDDRGVAKALVVSGRVENQGDFRTRTTNRYGKSADEQALVLEQLATVEPLLRASCTLAEICNQIALQSDCRR